MRIPRRVVLCGLEGSDADRGLARVSAGLAEAMGAQLHFLHVLGTSSSSTTRWNGRRGAESDAEDRLRRICEAAGAGSADRHVLAYGDPARRIAAMAEDIDATLIVLGTRARSARPDALLGSVSRRLAADAPCPVLIVPTTIAHDLDAGAWRRRTFVCGLDGSPVGWCAARASAQLASDLGGSLAVVSVGVIPATAAHVSSRLRRQVAATIEPGSDRTPCPLRYDTRAGDPAWELERVAAASTAPLIAVGSRGNGPWHDAVLGSVTRRLLLMAHRPILILPATASCDPLA